MLKLKNVRNLDARQSLLVDSAYFQAKPPERPAQRRRQKPPEQLFMRHLVYDVLTADNILAV